ncbi:MAG TPA: phosphodiester glycosidase family protein [Solirubrobacteraceae bacterium]|nr:phosphodiester glycosidase family protein [Solirubrobacteraceae bacterium]
MELGAVTRPRRGSPGARRRPRREVSGLGRLRRAALVAAIVALIPVAFSFLGTMSEPSNSSFGIRSVEWLRDHGAAGLVAQIESFYYGLTAPAKGGPALHALPRVGYGASAGAGATLPAAYRPARVPSLLHPALPGEGVWRATRPGLEAEPPVLLTTVRDQPEYPRVVAGLAWIDTKRTRLTLDPGRLEPSVTLPRGTMDVPRARRGGLLATFNSGFKLSDSHGGFVLGGRTYATMQNGEGTLVGYADGHVDVVDWSYGPTAPGQVAFARQNLPLIVNEGRTNPNLSNGAEWGATVGSAILVWRSGIGVDRRGNLIYAAGEDQTVSSLARALIRAGAVRAMELDINSYWVSFITYGAPWAEGPRNLLPAMNRSAGRYLEPDDRDFFAVYAR